MQLFANQLLKFRKKSENKGIFSDDRCLLYILMKIEFNFQLKIQKKEAATYYFAFRKKV